MSAKEENKLIAGITGICVCAILLSALLVASGCSDKDKGTAAAVGKFLLHSCAADVARTNNCYREVKLPNGTVYKIRIERTR